MPDKIDLHVHPYFESYGIESIAGAMYSNGLRAIGLINYNEDNFVEVRKLAGGINKDCDGLRIITDGSDELAIQMHVENESKEKLYLLRGIEVLNDDFHLLVIGNISKIKKGNSIEQNIETAFENDALVIIDHPFVDALKPWKGISEEKKKRLTDLCIKYPFALEWNSYCIPWVRKFFLGNDANLEVEEFSDYLYENKDNLYTPISKNIHRPIIADSDVHARNKKLLREIGAGNIETWNINWSSGQEVIRSLKHQIMLGEDIGYHNNKKYVSFIHFVKAFGLPVVLNLAKKRG